MTTSSVRGVLLSSVARKAVSTLTGVGLVIFAVLHLAGNLLLFKPGGQAFNAYGESLHSLGPLFYVGEVGLFLLIATHAVQGILLKMENHKARGSVAYRDHRTKGGGSRWNLSSLGMAFSGVVILAFVVLHLLQIRFGPGIAEGYGTQVGGQEARDLYRLTVDLFANPIIVGIYVFSVLVLAAHLRHGIWSAVQSLGIMRTRSSSVVYALSALIAALLFAGFAAMPLYLHFANRGTLS